MNSTKSKTELELEFPLRCFDAMNCRNFNKNEQILNHAQRQKLVGHFRQLHWVDSLAQANLSHIYFIACAESRGRLGRKWGDGIKPTSCPSQLNGLCGAHDRVKRAD